MKTPRRARCSALWVCLCIVAFTGCSARRSGPPPSSVDVSGSDISEETLKTLVVSLNKRYENLDSRIIRNQEKMETLEKELISLRETLGVIGPARRTPTVKTTETRRSYEGSKKKSLPLAASSADAKRLYQTAFAAYSQGNYPTAISQFQEFLNAFPSSDLADNAFYWIGESYYAKEDFERAISSWLKLVDRYPQGNKVPDALLKVGFSYARLKNPQKAEAFLTRVMDNYPFSEAARKARARLDQLE